MRVSIFYEITDCEVSINRRNEIEAIVRFYNKMYEEEYSINLIIKGDKKEIKFKDFVYDDLMDRYQLSKEKLNELVINPFLEEIENLLSNEYEILKRRNEIFKYIREMELDKVKLEHRRIGSSHRVTKKDENEKMTFYLNRDFNLYSMKHTDKNKVSHKYEIREKISEYLSNKIKKNNKFRLKVLLGAM